MNIECFLIVESARVKRSLRRYSRVEHKCAATGWSYHDWHAAFDEVSHEPHTYIRCSDDDAPPHDDTRWPRRCGCGYEFIESDGYQLSSNRIYIRADGKLGEYTLHDAPVGAMWDAWWYSSWKGEDGRSLVVNTPGGEWVIDSRASNCTIPNDDVHKCWVRHGEPPKITVDKNGRTCAAGEGSIQCGKYHGFLRNGFLVDA